MMVRTAEELNKIKSDSLSLQINPADIVAIGGPQLNEVEAVVPVIKHIRDIGGNRYHALVIILKDDVDISHVQEFRDKTIEKMIEIGGNVSRETLLDMNLTGDVIHPIDDIGRVRMSTVGGTAVGVDPLERCGGCHSMVKKGELQSEYILCSNCYAGAVKYDLLPPYSLRNLYYDIRRVMELYVNEKLCHCCGGDISDRDIESIELQTYAFCDGCNEAILVNLNPIERS